MKTWKIEREITPQEKDSLNMRRKACRLTKPWVKSTRRLATLDDTLNMPIGIRGCFESHFSLNMKSIVVRQPKIMRQMTCDELQGKVLPPKSSPRSSINVNPRIERLPTQSMAFTP